MGAIRVVADVEEMQAAAADQRAHDGRVEYDDQRAEVPPLAALEPGWCRGRRRGGPGAAGGRGGSGHRRGPGRHRARARGTDAGRRRAQSRQANAMKSRRNAVRTVMGMPGGVLAPRVKAMVPDWCPGPTK